MAILSTVIKRANVNETVTHELDSKSMNTEEKIGQITSALLNLSSNGTVG